MPSQQYAPKVVRCTRCRSVAAVDNTHSAAAPECRAAASQCARLLADGVAAEGLQAFVVWQAAGAGGGRRARSASPGPCPPASPARDTSALSGLVMAGADLGSGWPCTSECYLQWTQSRPHGRGESTLCMNAPLPLGHAAPMPEGLHNSWGPSPFRPDAAHSPASNHAPSLDKGGGMRCYGRPLALSGAAASTTGAAFSGTSLSRTPPASVGQSRVWR